MTEFTLELYYERDTDAAGDASPGPGDRDFANGEAAKLKAMVHEVAPHIALRVCVLKAANICRSAGCLDGQHYDVPNQNPSFPGRQSLLITNENIKRDGLAGTSRGCVSKQRMVEMIQRGENSANITIHEWLHTICGQDIAGWKVPYVDSSSEYDFANPSGHDTGGSETWHEWYKFVLSGTRRHNHA
jgi:hypothetical protein